MLLTFYHKSKTNLLFLFGGLWLIFMKLMRYFMSALQEMIANFDQPFSQL